MELMDPDFVLPSHRWADLVEYAEEFGATLYGANTASTRKLSLRVADVEDGSGDAGGRTACRPMTVASGRVTSSAAAHYFCSSAEFGRGSGVAAARSRHTENPG